MLCKDQQGPGQSENLIVMCLGLVMGTELAAEVLLEEQRNSEAGGLGFYRTRQQLRKASEEMSVGELPFGETDTAKGDLSKVRFCSLITSNNHVERGARVTLKCPKRILQ